MSKLKYRVWKPVFGFFSSCIIAIDWMAIHFCWKKPLFVLHENIISTPSPFVTVDNNTNSTWDEIFPWLNERFFPLWILIPITLVLIISFLGFVGALFKWSILLIPYCVYRCCWFIFALVFFLPFLFFEFLILLVLSIFPKCPYFLIVFTWIVSFIESIFIAIIASELVIIVIEFHLMSVVFGCYQKCKNKNSVEDEATEVLDGTDVPMHVAIKVEKQRNYLTMEV